MANEKTKEQLDKEAAEKVATQLAEELRQSHKCKVRRLSETKNRTGSYSYELVGGIKPELIKQCRMYGQVDQYKDKIFYSTKMKGQVGQEIEADVRIVGQTGAQGKFNTLVFARTAEEIKEQHSIEDTASNYFKTSAAFGVNRVQASTSIAAGLAAEAAKQVLNRRVAQTTQPEAATT